MAKSDRNGQENTRHPDRKPGLSVFLLTALFAALLAAVLYGMFGGPGKEGDQSAACSAARETATRLTPLAKGQVAAFSVTRTPRPAVDISFDGPDGKRLSLTDFRGKNVLLNLWATWCVPCRVEMPALDRLQASLGSADFEVVAINIDTARLERRKTFLESAGVTRLRFYTDPKAEVFQTLKQAGKVLGLPTTILIDPNGCELGLMAGPAEWDGPEAIGLLRAALAAPGKE